MSDPDVRSVSLITVRLRGNRRICPKVVDFAELRIRHMKRFTATKGNDEMFSRNGSRIDRVVGAWIKNDSDFRTRYSPFPDLTRVRFHTRGARSLKRQLAHSRQSLFHPRRNRSRDVDLISDVTGTRPRGSGETRGGGVSRYRSHAIVSAGRSSSPSSPPPASSPSSYSLLTPSTIIRAFNNGNVTHVAVLTCLPAVALAIIVRQSSSLPLLRLRALRRVTHYRGNLNSAPRRGLITSHVHPRYVSYIRMRWYPPPPPLAPVR